MQALESRARQLHLPLQAVAADAIEKELLRLECEISLRHRVHLPLVPSTNPGSLRSMTNGEIDDVLDA